MTTHLQEAHPLTREAAVVPRRRTLVSLAVALFAVGLEAMPAVTKDSR